MYTFFTDKKEIFEATIKLKGASAKNSQCRLVLETEDWSLMFPGEIVNETCQIPVKRLREVLSADTVGKVKLEIIAEDMYFTPWESDFVVETSKAVTMVEVKSQSRKPLIEESVVEVAATVKKSKKPIESPKLSIAQKFVKELYENNITVEKITDNPKALPKLAKYFINENNLNEFQIKRLIKNLPMVVSKLKLK